MNIFGSFVNLIENVKFGKWYTKNVEKGIRKITKLLRDNGINTTYSCEHAMVVEAECYDSSDIDFIEQLLTKNGYKTFRIELRYYKKDGESSNRHFLIKFPMIDGYICDR